MSGFQLLKYFILILVGLWLVWFLTGGVNRQISQEGAFIEQPETPENSWKTYNKNLSSFNIFSQDQDKQQTEIRKDLERAQEIVGVSAYKDKIILKKGSATSQDPNREYLIIELVGTSKDKVSMEGWRLQSVMTGKSMAIPEASYLPHTSTVNSKRVIFASSGDRFYITTGRSPIGTSFRTNLCTGYLEQFQNFYPYLKKECPVPEDEDDFITIGPNALNDDCIDYVERLRTCEINTKTLPLDMQHECQVYINNEINYNACVSKHKNKPGFYRQEWRIFLNREEEMWKQKRETIKLMDAEGNLIDILTY